jgi:hypothetical protein
VQEGVFGRKIYGVHFGGQGGAGTSAVCPFHTGIDSFGVEVMHEGKRYVEEINVSCRQTSGRKLHLTMVPFGGANDNAYGGTARLACQPGELATGIHGRASEYIEAIGLICGPEPFVLEGPTTTTPESSAPPLDKERASILKQPGDSVAKHVGKPKVDVVSNQPGAGVADAVKKPNIDVLSNPGATSRGSFSGVWATVTSGGGRYMMTLAQEGGSVDGSYASPDGRITGTISGQISGGVLNYRWSEGSSTGSGKFTLAADGNSFEGWWSSDASPDARNGWNGSRK